MTWLWALDWKFKGLVDSSTSCLFLGLYYKFQEQAKTYSQRKEWSGFLLNENYLDGQNKGPKLIVDTAPSSVILGG